MNLPRWLRRRAHPFDVITHEHAETPCNSSHGNDCCYCETLITEPHSHISIKRHGGTGYDDHAGVVHTACVPKFVEWAALLPIEIRRTSGPLCPQAARRDLARKAGR